MNQDSLMTETPFAAEIFVLQPSIVSCWGTRVDARINCWSTDITKTENQFTICSHF